MEGEGAVAVVRGLAGAGLAVTLLRAGTPLAVAHADVAAPSHGSRPAVGAAVEAAVATVTAQTAYADDVYTSSYQMSHCRSSDSSPVRLLQSTMRGYSFRCSTSRCHDEEAFVESLRKYPSPARADLRRLLVYAQKNASSRSPSPATRDGARNQDEIPTRDNDRTNFGFKRDTEIVPTSPRKSRCDNNTGAYDYLSARTQNNSTSGRSRERRGRGSEVRYLTQVKQCLKEKLQEICQDEPTMVCPKIQSRYAHHRKQCHKQDSQKHEKDKCCKSCTAETSSATSTHQLPSTSREEDRSCANGFKHDKACFCNQPNACDCGAKSRSIIKSKIHPQDLLTEMNKHKKCLATRVDQEMFMKQLQDIVTDWLQEIPVYANCNTCDRVKRDDIIAELINTLGQLDKDDTFLENAEVAIKKCLRILPMWRPETKQSQELFEEQMKSNLLQRLKNILPDEHKVEDEISKWVDSIPMISTELEKEKVLRELIEKLGPMPQLSDNKYREDLKSEIAKSNDKIKVPSEGGKTQNKTIDLLSDAVTDTLLDSSKKIQTDEYLTDIIEKWFKYIPDITDMDILESKRDIKTLATKLQELQRFDNVENNHNIMRREILHWLQSVQKRRGKYLDSGTQENLVNKLINMIKDDIDESEYLMHNKTDSITRNIWDWLESQPGFSQGNSLIYRDMVNELSERLRDLKDSTGNVTEYNVESELNSWFDKLSQKQGIIIDPKNKNKLLNLLIRTVNSSRKRKNWKKPHTIFEIISNTVADIMDDLDLAIERNNKERLKDIITKALTQDWDEVQTDKLIPKVISILKDNTNLRESQIQMLAKEIISKIKEATINDLDNTVVENIPITEDFTTDKLKTRVQDIFEPYSITNKEQIISGITDTLAEIYGQFNNINNDFFETIYGSLKKANLNENIAKELTKKLVDMLSQLKNEGLETINTTPSYGSGESLLKQKQVFMQKLEQEITDFMEKILNESSSFYREKTSALEDSNNQYNRFKNPPLKTSTPTGSSGGPDEDNQEENKYKYQVKEKFRQWITSQGLDEFMDNAFKEDMINDLAADMIDRQKYLQLSNTKTTKPEEIEHLRYQIFKWTSKLPNLNSALNTRTSNIKLLMKSLDSISVPNLLRELKKQQDISNIAEGSVSSSENDAYVIEQDTSEFFKHNLHDAIMSWLNEIPTLKPKNCQQRCIIDARITELCDKLKTIRSNGQYGGKFDVIKLCEEEIMKFLLKLQHGQNCAEMKKMATELLSYLKNIKFFPDNLHHNQEASMESINKTIKRDAIKEAVRNWCRKLPLKNGKTYDDINDIVDDLAEGISQYLLITDMENLSTFMNQILNSLKKLPLQFDKDDTENLPQFTETLIEPLKSALNNSDKNYYKTTDSTNTKTAYKKAAEVMYDNIQNWCDNLPLDLSEANIIKQNLARRLIKKVGEINLDPEIFHDDYLYEEILGDEINQILDSLQATPELKEMIPDLKENLIKDILDAKNVMKNEMAGYAYKQQLRDVISKTLSSIGLPVTEDTPLEVLKDNLADAFISLHYVADDDELRKKFKNKIFDEVNKFCNDYLKRNPSLQIDANEVNQALYKALQKVPVPNDESLRREVGQIRIKDLVTDWFKELPLEETPSHSQANKMLSVLAKRLYEIEKEAELNPDIDLDETINQELTKWLKKFKLKSRNGGSIQPMCKELINKLKTTKDARKLDETVVRKSLEYADMTSWLNTRPSIPASSLSADDRTHLERIRERTSLQRTSRPRDRKDSLPRPEAPHVATGMQTEEEKSPVNNFQMSQNASIQTIINIPEPVTPQVIVKEYYWNSHESPTMQQSGSILSCMRTPATQPDNSVQDHKSSENTPHITAASQTLPLPVSEETITEETSTRQETKRHSKNIDGPKVGSSKQSCLERLQQLANENDDSEIAHYNPDDKLQLTAKRSKKYCVPCIDRGLPKEYEVKQGAGSCKTFQDTSQLETEFQNNHPEGQVENKGFLDDHNYLNNRPCFRRSVCHTPTRVVDNSKHKKGAQQCSCKNPTLIKCTIRPQSPCPKSHKSCFVSRKQCPKCWDGFCPHPSYLFFRRD